MPDHFHTSFSQTSSVPLIFLADVEFRTLKQTGGNSSETGRNSARQQDPHILTYSYDFSVCQQLFDLCALYLSREEQFTKWGLRFLADA